MIESFADDETRKIFQGQRTRVFDNIAAAALRRLRQLHRVERLQDLRDTPGNRLEALSGDRSGQHSIRINQQYRICFHWQDGNAYDVEVVDYH